MTHFNSFLLALVALFGLSQSAQAQTPDYTIECKVEIEQVAAGFCFGMTSPGNYLMWQFNVERGYPRFRPHEWVNGGPRLIGETELYDEFEIGREFDLRIEVTDNGTYATTYIDDQIIDERAGNFPLGRMGFRASKAENSDQMETSFWDDFKVTVDGQVQSYEDFSAGNNLFDGGEVIDGRLYIVGSHPADNFVWQYEVSEYPDYTIDCDFEIKDHCFGLAFAKSPSTGSFYMWQINKENRLNPHYNTGGWAVYPSIDLATAGLNVSEGQHHLTLKVSNNARRLVTIIDGVEVDSREGSFVYGQVGFRQDALPDNTPEAAYMDNLVVKAGEEVVFSEDFNNKYAHPFQHGCPADGRWLVTGYLSAPISWLNTDPSASILEFDVIPGKGGVGLMQGYLEDSHFQLWALVEKNGRPALRRHAWRDGGWAYHNAGAERDVNAPVGALYNNKHHVRLVKQGNTLTYYLDGYMLDRYDQKASNNQDVFDAYYGFRMDEGDYCYVDNFASAVVDAEGKALTVLNEDCEGATAIFDLPLAEIDGTNWMEVRSPGGEVRIVEKSRTTTVSERWTTFAPAHPVHVPAGLLALAVNGYDEEGILNLGQVTEGTTINIGEGLLLTADSEGDYVWTYSIDPVGEVVNQLVGTPCRIPAEAVDGAVFTLTDTDKGQIFAPAAPDSEVQANEAYMVGSSDREAYHFSAVTTAIRDVVDGLNRGDIYDLSGRKVARLAKGMYIIGGRKVVMK